jgi:hypothetical protein
LVHTLLLGLLHLEVVGRHALAGATVDDDRLLRAEPLGRARDVHRGVAPTVDSDAPAEERLTLAFHASEHRDGVEDARRACRALEARITALVSGPTN